MSPFALNGKTVLVTGASSGIGRATAIECSRMGAKLVITGRNEDRLNATMSELDGDGHLAIKSDLTDEDSLKGLVSRMPQLDGLVLCAGINQTLPVAFLTRKKLDSIFNTNFFSQVEITRSIVKKKLLNHGASVVAISSIGGVESFSAGTAAYGASKAAILSWMKTSAKEFAPKFRFNCICPGQVNTPMNCSGEISQEQYESYRKTIPMKRFGEPEEIAYTVVYLLSNATAWMTGSEIIIDGGTTL